MICLIKENIDQVIFINLKYTIKKKFTLSTGCCFNWLPWTSTGSSHREMFLEINLNQETLKLYTSCLYWKKQYRSTIRKHALLYGKHECQHSVLKIFMTHFMALVSFYTSWNISENYRFSYILKGHRKRAVPWNGLRII